METTYKIIIALPSIIIALDILYYLLAHYVCWIKKDKFKGHSPLWKLCGKATRRLYGGMRAHIEEYLLYILGIFGVLGSFALLLTVWALQALGAVAVPIVVTVFSFIAASFLLRWLFSLGSTIKKLCTVAHTHKPGDSIDIDISLDTLTKEEKDLINKLRKRVK